MANSVMKDRQGPDWPLGFVSVTTSGTPVSFMINVDPTNANDPATVTPGTVGTNEYTFRCQQIVIQGFKPSGGKMVNNTGNVYVIRRPSTGGTGNLTDTGAMVMIVAPGQTGVLASSALVNDVFSPYRYRLDADISGEGALITILIF